MATLKKMGLQNKNALWAITEYIWYPALLFLSTRYFLHYLGGHNYGTWMYLNAIVASSSILNVGIVGAVIKVVSAEIGGGACRRRIGDIANTALGIALISGVITASIMVVVIVFGWREESSSTTALAVTAIAAATLIVLEYADAAFASMLKGGEHFRETAKIEVLSKTVQIIGALAVTVLWRNLYFLFLVLIVVSILRVTTKMLQVRGIYSLERLRPSLVHYALLLPYAKWGWLHGAGGFLLAIADRLIVGSVLGAESLAYYSLLLMLPQQLHAMTAAAVSVTFPRISALLSATKIREVKLLAARVNLIAAAAAAAATLVFVVFRDQIFMLWLGKALPQDAMSAMAPLSVAFFILCLNVTPYYTLLGMGQIRNVATINLVAGVASVVVLVSLLDTYGLYAAALSKGVYGVILLIQFSWVSGHLRSFNGNRG